MKTAHDEKLLRTFGRGVAAVRKSRQVTQQELAEKVNLSVVAIAYIETGRRWPKLETLDKISRALDVSIQSLFSDL